MINDTEERLFAGPRPSLGERVPVRCHGQASRGVTAVRGDVRAELGVPGKWPSRALPEGHFKGGDASVFSPFFWVWSRKSGRSGGFDLECDAARENAIACPPRGGLRGLPFSGSFGPGLQSLSR